MHDVVGAVSTFVARRVSHCPTPHFHSIKSALTRQASTSPNHRFPFPPTKNPTPHEIFHLSRSASQDEIKRRYYELVKLYHPDAAHCQHGISPSVRNARFRAITHAYGVLCGRHGPSHSGDYHEARDEAMRAELRRRSRPSRSAASSSSSTTAADTQIWYSLMAFVIAGMIAAMTSTSSHIDRVEQHTRSAAANLAQARAEAEVYGLERRRKIREHVKAFHGARDAADGSEDPEMSKECQNELLLAETVPRRRVSR